MGSIKGSIPCKIFISPDVWEEAYHLPPDSYVHILGLHEFHDMKLNFNCDYIDTNWGMCTDALAGNVVLLMEDIPVHWMMEELRHNELEHRDDIVDIMDISKWDNA